MNPDTLQLIEGIAILCLLVLLPAAYVRRMRQRQEPESKILFWLVLALVALIWLRVSPEPAPEQTVIEVLR